MSIIGEYDYGMYDVDPNVPFNAFLIDENFIYKLEDTTPMEKLYLEARGKFTDLIFEDYLRSRREKDGVNKDIDFRSLPVGFTVPLIRSYLDLCQERSVHSSPPTSSARRKAVLEDAVDKVTSDFVSERFIGVNRTEKDQKALDEYLAQTRPLLRTIGEVARFTGNSSILRLVYKAITEEIVQLELSLKNPAIDKTVESKTKSKIRALRSSTIYLVDQRSYTAKNNGRGGILRRVTEPYSEGANSRFEGPGNGLMSIPESVPQKKRIILH